MNVTSKIERVGRARCCAVGVVVAVVLLLSGSLTAAPAWAAGSRAGLSGVHVFGWGP